MQTLRTIHELELQGDIFQPENFLFVPGIASCSHHAVSGTSSQTLSSAVTVMFIPYLQQEGIVALACLSPSCQNARNMYSLQGNHIYKSQEGCIYANGPGNTLKDHCVMFQSSSNFSLCYLVHEGTLVHAVSVLSQWSSRLTVEVPTALLDWLKKAFTLKTSTSLVRHAYLQAMLGAFRGRSHEGHYATCGIYRSLI